MNTLTHEELSILIKEVEPNIIKTLNKYASNKNITFDNVIDALQDAKLRSFKHIATYDASKPFFYWFLRIALNCIYDITKKQNKLQSYSLDQIYESTGDKHIPAINNVYDEMFGFTTTDQYSAAYEILSQLPNNLREPLYKKEILDMSYEDMAKEMNATIPALRVSVCRAKKKAKEIALNYKDKLYQEI